jgi:PAS domain S-box-containing protein
MIRSPEELIKPIKEAVDHRAVLFSHILLVATITIHTIIDPASSSFVRIGGVIFGLLFTLFIVFRLFDFVKINSRPRVYLVVYHVFGILGMAFLSDPVTPYVLVWMLIIFWSNLYYGRKGVWASVGTFTIMTVIKYIYLLNIQTLTVSQKLYIWAPVPLLIAICSIFINIQKVFDWDRARLRELVKESSVEEKRLRALINNMTESVLVLDKEGIIRLYNAAALALFNTNNSLSDKPLDGFIKLEDEKGKIITTVDLLPKDSKPIIRSDVRMRYSREDAASLSIVATPIRSTFGQERDEEGYVITMRDITREKSLEEERDEFISVISHELRTPVTVAEAGVSNALLMSAKTPGNEKITKSLQTAHDQAVFLANMLNDLTTFARAEKGMLEMNLEEFDPRELLENLRNDYRGAVEAKGMSVVVETDPSTPLRMASNRLYIREILQNFVTNSIKYSDKGRITLSARAKDKGILYSVSDQGIGISTSDQKKIFTKFFRAEDYRTRSTNGTGLGLYIVKKLAKILDASFEVRSEVGSGSSFSVYVPDKSDLLAAKKATAAAPVATTHVSPVPAQLVSAPVNPAQPTAAESIPVTTVTAAGPSLGPRPVLPNPTLPKQG